MELVAHGIRVNSLTPTATDPMESLERAARWGRPARSGEQLKNAFEPFRKGVPMQKLPSPSDYGRAAVFLASDDAGMITGTDLRVDAGAIARYWAWNPSEQVKCRTAGRRTWISQPTATSWMIRTRDCFA